MFMASTWKEDSHVEKLYNKTRVAYKARAKILLRKMSLDTALLKYIGGLHPYTRGHEIRYLLKLSFLLWVISQDDELGYKQDIRRYQVLDFTKIEPNERMDILYTRGGGVYVA